MQLKKKRKCLTHALYRRQQSSQREFTMRPVTFRIPSKPWTSFGSFASLKKKERERESHQMYKHSVNSVTQPHYTLCNPMDCSTPSFPVHHQLLKLTQNHVHRVSDAIQPSHPLSSPYPPAFNLFQHQGLFQWVSSSHQVAKVLELQLQHQSFQWLFRTDFL